MKPLSTEERTQIIAALRSSPVDGPNQRDKMTIRVLAITLVLGDPVCELPVIRQNNIDLCTLRVRNLFPIDPLMICLDGSKTCRAEQLIYFPI